VLEQPGQKGGLKLSKVVRGESGCDENNCPRVPGKAITGIPAVKEEMARLHNPSNSLGTGLKWFTRGVPRGGEFMLGKKIRVREIGDALVLSRPEGET